MKKKILIFCDYFLPSTKAGGPLRSIVALVELLKSNTDVTIITRNHDLCVATPYDGIVSDCAQEKDGYRILYLSKKNILKKIYQHLQKNTYDIVYCNSFFSPKFSVMPQFMLMLQNKQPRIIISPRGELGGGALLIKSIRKKWYIPLFKFLYAKKRTEFLAASEQEKKEIDTIFKKQFTVTAIANLVSYPAVQDIVNNKIENQLNMIFVSRLSKKKNLLYALNILKSVQQTIRFTIFGLIEDQEEWNACLTAMLSLPKNIEVVYQGELHPDCVVDTLKSYDLFFLPTLNENYGYAIVEALAAGCPVLLSDQTPWHDLSSHDAGWEFSLSQPEKFVSKIAELSALSHEQYCRYKQNALNYYKNKIIDHDLEKKYIQFFKR